MTNSRALLVPINGTAVAFGALSLATKLAQMNKGKVFAIDVIEVARHLPLEGRASRRNRAVGGDLLPRALFPTRPKLAGGVRTAPGAQRGRDDC